MDIIAGTNEPCSNGNYLLVQSLTQFDRVFNQPDTCNSTFAGVKQDIYYRATGYRQSQYDVLEANEVL